MRTPRAWLAVALPSPACLGTPCRLCLTLCKPNRPLCPAGLLDPPEEIKSPQILIIEGAPLYLHHLLWLPPVCAACRTSCSAASALCMRAHAVLRPVCKSAPAAGSLPCLPSLPAAASQACTPSSMTA